nr:MAG TPA: hypothetical protein [Bacteriophage sp.]
MYRKIPIRLFLITPTSVLFSTYSTPIFAGILNCFV